jgi:lysophospholipase L1-like esterase
MRHLAFPPVALFLLTLGTGCGSSASSQSSNLPPGDAGGGGGNDAAEAPDADDAGATQVPVVAAGANFGTYIVLGDSISDKGGQGPFFYDLLHQNDDATYPEWKGKDLATRFPGIQYVHAAVAGSITASYGDFFTQGAPVMSDQITGLGSSYPGDILVTITIGGNDLVDHAPDAVTGLDTSDRTKFAANIKADLDAITASGRLGGGKVYILETNIYDSSDGQGNFKSAGPACPPYTVGPSTVTTVFGNWDGILTQAIQAHASNGDFLVDAHGLFAGHGFNSKDNWYYSDCIHPNTKGHNQLRKRFWQMLTGEVIGN